MASNAGTAMEQQLLAAASMVEEQVDAQIEKLDKMDEDDLEAVRRRRLEALKKGQKDKKEWLALGHGEYSELKDELEFFAMCKKSTKIVCQFYRDSTFRCKIVDKHLDALARSHPETRFCKINADKSMFLVKRLKVKVIPTIVLIRDGQCVDFVIGFGDLGGTDEFTTEMMEWRIAHAGVINYSGDLANPPDPTVTKPTRPTLGVDLRKKTIRGQDDDNSSDDD
ncbi:PREDICTED: thioredoxin domain-containing protein 9-like [Priapulus caudatus]|uniref:Thioredoxin domain-containing protein 9 n=1 Tax=Priapulus caudatus TaxID=37621 RepID=A0ABM1EWJ2_PRICU|nr:PREDICTED: thioredoxin domain-containing protein 9-like [Priapulus caudatus]